jgi:site-specific DNA-methyltransferase (adenine-specific)
MDYTNKSRTELIALCKEQKIKGHSNKTKEELIKLLSNTAAPPQQPKRTKPKVAPSSTRTMPLELNRIICGDCKEVLKTFPADSIDLTITSPPYDNIRDYNGYTFTEEDMSEIAKELYRRTKEGGVVVWVVGDATENGSETGTSFKQALEFMRQGFKLHDTMIYEKNTSSFPAKRTGTRYTQIFEYMFVFCKGSVKTANLICDKPNKWAGHTNWGKKTDRTKEGELRETADIKPVPEFSPRNNIWRYNVGKGFNSSDKESHEHPAIFPERLAEDHILSWSNEGDVVLDPFSGSGTTAKMAKKNKRNYIGIEISQEYCTLSERILEKY